MKLSKINLVGFSLGSLIALDFDSNFQDRLSSLTVIGTTYKRTDKERALIISLLEFPKIIQEAANSFSPALIANYAYEVVKDFNSYYQSTSILGADSPSIISFRVALSQQTANVIKSSMSLLGINVPQRM